MSLLVRQDASEQKFPVSPVHGALGPVQSCPEAGNAVMATTVASVELMSDSDPVWRVISDDDHAQEDQQFTGTPMYITYARKANSGHCWFSMCADRAREQFLIVSIPNNVRELSDRCFQECKNLRRVTFGCSSCLKRIGVCCFERSGVVEVTIPDSVHELCYGCFQKCESLRRVSFGSLSSLEVFPALSVLGL